MIVRFDRRNDLQGKWSTVKHGRGRLTISGLQSKKKRAGILNVSLRSTLGSSAQGHRCWMIGAADECQSFGQAPHGYTVDGRFFHYTNS
jgi:hypothetical protein